MRASVDDETLAVGSGETLTDGVSVLLVEDDAMVRGWVALALAGSEFRLAGTAHTAAAALELATRRHPDVFLVDYRLPDEAGTELVRAWRRNGVTTPAVLMTANAERGFNELARDAGAQGSALKTGKVDELLETLRAVLRGESAFDYRHPRRPSHQAPLSPREREVLRLVAAGYTNRQVAAALGLSAETVKTLLERLYAKLGVRRRAEAVSTAHSLGILWTSEP